MRLRSLALAALALTLALPAAAERRDRPTAERAQLETMRTELLLEAELARPIIGDQAVQLIQERARHAQRLEQLELVSRDGRRAFDAAFERGDDAAELLFRSPSATLVGSELVTQRTERVGRPAWTRGSWMDSPDGAS